MDMTTFRPLDNTAAAIAEAIVKAEAAQVEQHQRLRGLKDSRDTLLLDGSAADLALAERALNEARGDHERLEAVLGQLRARHVAAEKAETIQRVRTAAAEYSEADKARAAWWRKEGPKIRKILAEGHRLHGAVQAAAWDHQQQTRRMQERHPEEVAELLSFDVESNADDFASKVKFWAEGDQLEGGIQ